jgi:hypothetical protein
LLEKESKMLRYKNGLIAQAKRTGVKPEREIKSLGLKYSMLCKEKRIIEGQLDKINGMKLDAESKEHIIDDLKLTQSYTTLTKRIQALVPSDKIDKNLQSYTEASRDLAANKLMLNHPKMSVIGQITQENKLEAEEGEGAEMVQSIEDEWMMELSGQMTQAEQGMMSTTTPTKNPLMTREMEWMEENIAQIARQKQALLQYLATPSPSHSHPSPVPVIPPIPRPVTRPY